MQVCRRVGILLTVVAACGACGCTHARPSGGTAVTRGRADDRSLAALRDENKALRKDIDAKNALILKLTAESESYAENLRYLEAELRQSREALESAEKQFISADIGLQSSETKASAVAALAEARLAYDRTLRENPDAGALANVQMAREKVRQGEDQLSRERFASSVYFAKRAVTLLEESPSRKMVRIISVDQANMRRGPGLEYDVIERLVMGTVLYESKSINNWHKVRTRDGLEGWVHASVTAAR